MAKKTNLVPAEEHTTVRVPVELLTETYHYVKKDGISIGNQSEALRYAMRYFVKDMRKKYGEKK